jgi:hypothetical protein
VKRSRLFAGIVLLVLAALTILFLKASYSAWLAASLALTGLALVFASGRPR